MLIIDQKHYTDVQAVPGEANTALHGVVLCHLQLITGGELGHSLRQSVCQRLTITHDLSSSLIRCPFGFALDQCINALYAKPG